MTDLFKIIKATTGMNAKDFVTNVLKFNYQSFCYRLRAGVMRLDHYHKIMHATGRTFEELFPSPYAAPRQLQKVTIPPLPKKAQPRIIKPKIKVTTTVEETFTPEDRQDAEEAFVPQPEPPIPPAAPASHPHVNKKEIPDDEMPFIDIGAGDIESDEQSMTPDPTVNWKPKIPPKKK